MAYVIFKVNTFLIFLRNVYNVEKCLVTTIGGQTDTEYSPCSSDCNGGIYSNYSST